MVEELDHLFLRPKREPHPRDYFTDPNDGLESVRAPEPASLPEAFSHMVTDGVAGEENKTCVRCKRVLPLGAFYRNRFFRDGRQITCSECGRELARSYYHRHVDRLRVAARDRMRKHYAAKKAARTATN